MPDAPVRTDDRPARRSLPTVLLFLVSVALLLASDLFLKDWAMANAPRGSAWVLVPSVLAVTWTQNIGAVFGLMKGQRWIFIAASFAAMGIIGWFFCTSRTTERLLHVALALILAGALGNLYDRTTLGFVRDMLYLFPGVPLPFGLSWPNTNTHDVYPWIFNLADVYLLFGIVLIVARSSFARPVVAVAKPA
jgi:lipoprotein signal peptidase